MQFLIQATFPQAYKYTKAYINLHQAWSRLTSWSDWNVIIKFIPGCMKSNNNKKHAIIIIGVILMVPSNYIVPIIQQLHQPIERVVAKPESTTTLDAKTIAWM